ncbi:POC1 centriolar protein A [Borealophlyctis nickersoniae]|nr:POC1 centriolar protein A [Borealophlyctis nickersoniae]
MVTSVAFHPAGTVIASASTDRSIKLFDIRTHKLIQHYGDAHSGGTDVGGGGGVNSIAFGGLGGEWLASTGMDGVVKIWDLKEGHLFYTLHGHKHGPTTAAVFSPQGDYFATGGSDSQVMVWKSNFDEIARLGEEDQEAGLGEPAIAPAPLGTRSANRSPVAMHPPVVNGSGGASVNRKSGEPEIVNVGAPLFAEQNIEDDTQSGVAAGPFASRNQRTSPPRSPVRGEAGGQNQSYTTPLEIRTVPDQLATTLQHIVRQIDVLTQTMSILESRLTMNEDRVADMSRRLTEALDRLERTVQREEGRRENPGPESGSFASPGFDGQVQQQQRQSGDSWQPFSASRMRNAERGGPSGGDTSMGGTINADQPEGGTQGTRNDAGV